MSDIANIITRAEKARDQWIKDREAEIEREVQDRLATAYAPSMADQSER